MEGKSMIRPFHPDEIPQEIKRKIGMIYRIASPRRQGYTSQVAIIGSERGTFVKGSRFCGWLANEVCVLDALGATSVPVPAVLGFTEEMDGEQPQAWLLMEHLKGETVRHALFYEHDPAKRAQILFAFGEVLARIHETPVPDKWIGQGGNWLDLILVQAEHNLNNGEVKALAGLLEQLKKNKPATFRQTLIHGDYTIDNVIVHNGKVSGVIDWSGSAFGDPRYDVVLAIRPKPNAFQTDEDLDAFFAGYGEKIVSEEEYRYFAEGLYSFF
jgi:aminoglycoside phosphotransferase (APT) family kinase protein